MGRERITSVAVLWIFCSLVTQSHGEASPNPDANPASLVDHSQLLLNNPRITEHPKDEWFAKSQPGTLKCKAEGEPAPVVTWYQNGQLVVSDKSDVHYHRMVLNNGDLFFLRVIHTKNKFSDVGTYYCKATNSHGEAVSRNVSVNIAVLKDDFRQEPVDTIIAVGKTAILHCKPPRGEPEVEIDWFHNGEQVKPDARTQLRSDGDLIIAMATKEDAGEYVCKASNRAGEKRSSPASLAVLDIPVITRYPADVTADEGETIEFHCRVEGDSNLKWGWKKQDGTINPKRGRILPDHRLRIEQVDVTDEGIYICHAENAVGSVEAIGRLTVQYTPTFIIRPQTQSVPTGRTVTLQCAAMGNPLPTIFWKVPTQRQLLFTNRQKDHLSVAQDGTLRIAKIRKEDEGDYSCQAISTEGEAVTSATITVKDSDVRPPPIIQYGPQNQTQQVGGDALLRCQATGDPKPIVKWYIFDRPLSMKDPRFTQMPSGNLHITGLKPEDMGLYTCSVFSSLGETTWPAQLTLQSQYLATSIPADVSAFPGSPNKPVVSDVTGTSIRLAWEDSPDIGRSPVISYRVEYFGYGETETWVVAGAEYKNREVIIAGLNPNTTYVFLVRAENSLGLSGPSPLSDRVTTLDVRGGRHFLRKNLPRVEIEEGLRNVTVSLSAAVTLNSSAIKISWKVTNDNGFVDGFYVQYKKILDMDNAEHLRYGPMVTKRVPYYARSYIITGLDSYQYYQICVNASHGDVVKPCSHHMKQYTWESVPTGYPENILLHRESDTSVQLKWSPPDLAHRKGHIKGYRIKCFSEDLKHNCSRWTNGSTFSIIIDQLEPGTDYDIQIAAATAEGVGKWSQVLTIGPENADLMKKPWFIGLLIGVVGGSLFLFLLIFTIWHCYKRKRRKKLKEKWYTGGPRSFQKSQERNGKAMKNGYGVKDTEPALPPEFTTLLAQSRKEEGNEESLYNMARDSNIPEMKTFYQKASPVTPYATTTLLQAQNARKQGGGEQTFRPINQGCPQHSSGSGDSNTDRSNTTGRSADYSERKLSADGSLISDENGMLIKQQRKTSRPSLPQNQASVNWSDVLPPPPEHPPSDGEYHGEDQLYSEIQDNRPRSPLSPVSMAQLSACSCPVSHPHQAPGPGYNMQVYSDSDYNRCHSIPQFEQRPYSPKQFIQQRPQSPWQHVFQNMSRTLGHPHQHSNSPRGTPVYLHGYSQPWDCTHLPRGQFEYDYAQVPREEAYNYTTPLQENCLEHSYPFRGPPVDSSQIPLGGPGDYCEGPCRGQIEAKNNYNRSRSETDAGVVPHFELYKIESPPSGEYKVLGGSQSGSGADSGSSGRPGGLKGRSSSEGSDLKDKSFKRTLPSTAPQCNHPSLYHSRSESSPPGHCMMEEGYTRNAESPISEDPDYAEDSENGAEHDNGRDSMVANWESTEDCSENHTSSGSSEDGNHFLNEEDFASAIAQAAVKSGLTVVGTTVSDPNPKPAKKNRHHRRQARPPSPGYSTDSNYGTADMVHRPYPKSHRKKQAKRTGSDKGDNQPVSRELRQLHIDDEVPAYSKPNFPSSPTSPTGPKLSPFARATAVFPPEGSTTQDVDKNHGSQSNNRVGGMFQFGEDIPVV